MSKEPPIEGVYRNLSDHESQTNVPGSASQASHKPDGASRSDGSAPDLADPIPGFPSQEEIDEQAHRIAQLGPKQPIILPEGVTQGAAIRFLTRQIPKNEYNLPTFFYRSDFLPQDLNSLTQGDVDAAVVALDYNEGYPTYSNGRIWWNQLAHETLDAHLLFQRYLEQIETEGIRQLQLLSMSEHIAHDKIFELASIYYWKERARAHDIFQTAADRKRRLLRQRRLQDQDYDRSTALLNQLMAKFDDEDWVKGLDSVEAINALVLLTKVRRMSMGLAANGNAGGAPFDPAIAKSDADLIEEITKMSSQGGDAAGIPDNLAALMMDPNFVMQAQKLIVQVRGGQITQHQVTMRGAAADE
jgi:hypothetical protein